MQTALPSLQIEEKPSISFAELIDMFEMNLSKNDLHKVHVICKLFDLRNIVELLSQSALYPFGNLSKNELQEALVEAHFFSSNIYDFLEENQSPKDLRAQFYEILVGFTKEQIEKNTGFVKDFFLFEHHLRIALTAYRAKQGNRDLNQELKFEDLNDPFVMQIIVQKDMPTFEFPYPFEALNQLLANAHTPMDEYKALLHFRFNYFQEYQYQYNFAIDALLSYMVQLIYLEMFHKLDSKKGTETINQLVKDVE